MRNYLFAIIGFMLVACAHVGDEFKPPQREPCEIPVYVDGEYHHCISRDHWKREVERGSGPVR